MDVDGVVTFTQAPYHWVPAPGWGITGADAFGDLTGDGLADAVLNVEGTNLVVEGPLNRAVVVPGDELFALPDDVDVWEVADFDFDGVNDLQIYNWSTQTTGVVFGPISAAFDATQADPSVAVGDIDINGDGHLDRSRDECLTAACDRAVVRIWWGPLSYGTAPDTLVEFNCDVEGEDYYGGWTWLSLMPDVTGDRLVEGFTPGFSFYNDKYYRNQAHGCGPYVLGVPSSGTLLVADDFPTTSLQDSYSAVPDQDGNGTLDVLLFPPGRPALIAAPVAFVAGSVVGEEIASGSPLISRFTPTNYDLTGDGIADFIGRLDPDRFDDPGVDLIGPPSSQQADFVVVPGGPAFSSATWENAWEFGLDNWVMVPSKLFLEAGHLWAVALGEESVAVYDLGPATVVSSPL
jgi:hypothetical protein